MYLGKEMTKKPYPARELNRCPLVNRSHSHLTKLVICGKFVVLRYYEISFENHADIFSKPNWSCETTLRNWIKKSQTRCEKNKKKVEI